MHDCFEHLAEVPQRVGADHVAVVVHPERRLDELPGVDVEVVVPEIDQDLEELPLGVDGPDPGRELGLGGRADTLVPLGVGDVMLEEELRQALAERAEAARRDPGVAGGVGERRRVQLLIDPGGEPLEVVPAEGVESCDIGRGRAEGQPGERQDRHGRGRQEIFPSRRGGSGAAHLAGRPIGVTGKWK